MTTTVVTVAVTTVATTGMITLAVAMPMAIARTSITTVIDQI
jgi:hypothetical protein